MPHRAVHAKDFTGREANGVGLVRRIENMVNEIPAYRAQGVSPKPPATSPPHDVAD